MAAALTAPPTDECDTVAAIAKLTGTPRTTLQDAVARGEIPEHHLAGGSVVLRLVDVRAWLAAAATRHPGRPRATPSVAPPPSQPKLTRSPDGALYLSDAPDSPVTNDRPSIPSAPPQPQIETPRSPQKA